jgi:hypothetical protein
MVSELSAKTEQTGIVDLHLGESIKGASSNVAWLCAVET